jgi:hypothetical protein
LDRCKEIQENIFNFDLHRQPEDYALITAQKKNQPQMVKGQFQE